MTGHFTSGERRGAIAVAVLLLIVATVIVAGNLVSRSDNVAVTTMSADTSAVARRPHARHAGTDSVKTSRRKAKKSPAKRKTPDPPAPRAPRDEIVSKR